MPKNSNKWLILNWKNLFQQTLTISETKPVNKMKIPLTLN